MAQLIVFLLCTTWATVLSATVPEIQNPKTDIHIVEDINEYHAQHPEEKIIPLFGEVQPLGLVRFSFGKRNKGDVVLAQVKSDFNYTPAQDVHLNIDYPQSGVGSIITNIDIALEKSPGDGRAYIVAGGIGQRHVKIVIEARRTEMFGYKLFIFGNKA